MKKLLMVMLVGLGCLIATAPESHAGVSIGIGFGFPGYFGYRPYGYGCYPYAYPVAYYAPLYYSVGYRPYYWRHGRRIYRHHRWR